MSPAIWDQLQTLKEENPSSVEIDVTGIDKIERRTIHTIAKKLANVISQTIDKDDKKFLTIVPNTKSDKNGKLQISPLQKRHFYVILDCCISTQDAQR